MVSSIDSSRSYDLVNFISTTNNKTSSSTDTIKSKDSTLATTVNINDISGMRCFKSKEDMYNYCASNGISSIKDFSYALSGTEGVDTSNVDYEAEYESYMKDRGCNNQEELEALNSVSTKGGFIYSKADLMNVAKWDMASTTVGIESATRTNNDVRTGLTFDSELANNIISSASISNLASYVNNYSSSQSGSFADQVLNLQTFLGNVSKQDNVSSEVKSGISNYSQNVISSSDEITSRAIAEKASVEKDTSSILSSSAYKSLLISQYQS